MRKILVVFFALWLFAFSQNIFALVWEPVPGAEITLEQEPDDEPFANFLAQKGFINDNSKSPQSYNLKMTITRKELMKIIMKIAWIDVEEKCENKFRDVESDWGCKYIESAFQAWFISFNDGVFRPNDNVNVTEALKLIFKARWIQKIYNTDSWQQDYIRTAQDLWLIKQDYKNFTLAVSRGWIFVVVGRTYWKIETDVYTDDIQLK